MIGGRFKNTSVALAAAAGMFVGGTALTPAMAADLGGDCCADLEERVAELEATTVRKGNRKVSLKLSGHVNQALVFFDESATGDSDVYVVNNENSMTRFRLTGSAAIKPGWSAGFNIELGVRTAPSYGVGPNDADDGTDSILIRQSHLYVSSPLGKVTLGQASEATDGITEIDLSNTYQVAYGGGEGPLTQANFGVNSLVAADGTRANIVRYDTPTFAGFTVSASWGEDDRWSAALRYAGEFNGLRVAAGVGYTAIEDESDRTAVAATNTGGYTGLTSELIGASASVWHVPTGIFVTAAYHSIDVDQLTAVAGGTDDGLRAGTGDHWYVKAGIRRRFSAIGQTSLYGEYGESNREVTTVAGVPDRENNAVYWGLGIVQNIDAAAMNIYLGYRHVEDDDVLGGADTTELDQITVGARIAF